MIQVRSVADTDLEIAEHGLMLPLPGASPDSIVFEARDGESIEVFEAKSIEAKTHGEKKPFLKVSDVRLRLFITDARVAFACSKYDKGGGWIGGATALAMNAGSKILAARRRKGNMLVGHLRYPWISDVFARNKDGWLNEETLRLIVKLPGDESWTRVDFELPKESSATARASEIVRRAAAFRLGCEPDLSEDERAEFGRFAELNDLVWTKGENMVGVTFSSSWPVSKRSALFGPPGGAVRQASQLPEMSGEPLSAGGSDGLVSLSSLLAGPPPPRAEPAGARAAHTVAADAPQASYPEVAPTGFSEGAIAYAASDACKSCQAALAPEDRFCGACGHPVSGAG